MTEVLADGLIAGLKRGKPLAEVLAEPLVVEPRRCSRLSKALLVGRHIKANTLHGGLGEHVVFLLALLLHSPVVGFGSGAEALIDKLGPQALALALHLGRKPLQDSLLSRHARVDRHSGNARQVQVALGRAILRVLHTGSQAKLIGVDGVRKAKISRSDATGLFKVAVVDAPRLTVVGRIYATGLPVSACIYTTGLPVLAKAHAAGGAKIPSPHTARLAVSICVYTTRLSVGIGIDSPGLSVGIGIDSPRLSVIARIDATVLSELVCIDALRHAVLAHRRAIIQGGALIERGLNAGALVIKRRSENPLRVGNALASKVGKLALHPLLCIQRSLRVRRERLRNRGLRHIGIAHIPTDGLVPIRADDVGIADASRLQARVKVGLPLCCSRRRVIRRGGRFWSFAKTTHHTFPVNRYSILAGTKFAPLSNDDRSCSR